MTTTTKFHVFKINKTAAEFYAQIDEEGDDFVTVSVSADKLYADIYQSGDGVSIETNDGAVWLGEINDTSDYWVDDRDGFIQFPTQVYVDLM